MQSQEDQVAGGIWPIAPTSEEPETKLVDWRVFEVQQADRTGRTRHFVGSTCWHFDGQVSSAIVTFDPAARRGVTESARVYELRGLGSGIGVSAAHVWASWRKRCGATDVVDVTPEIEELISKQERT